MSIISTLLVLLGVIILLIGAVAYKKRTLIMEALYVRANAKRALRELEQNMYMSAYEEALKEELPKTMKEKATRDVQKKYNRS
jgi:Sec-independent protein translocase protein TatA